MRSIRRSVLGYFLLLLALALGLVALFVDQFAVDAIRLREKAETGRMDQAFKNRLKEAQDQFDAEITAEARSLAGELNRAVNKALNRRPEPGRGGGGPPGKGGGGPEAKGSPPLDPKLDPKAEPFARPPEPRPSFPGKAPDEDAREYLRRATGMMLIPPAANMWPSFVTANTFYHSWSPAWAGFESPRMAGNIQIPRLIHQLFEEGDHTGYYQFQVVAAYHGRPWQTIEIIRPARLAHNLSIDLDRLDDPAVESIPPDEIRVDGQGVFRRAVVWTALTPQGSRPLVYPVWLEPQSLASQSATGRSTPLFIPPSGLGGPRFRPFDFQIRVFIHAARPRDELDRRLASDVTARDEELQQIQHDTRLELTYLRARLGMIGAGSFVALVIGGWFIVARGLAPIRTLSEAVSRVSEKDFSLPVDRADLSVELAPIHARLTQTLDQLRAAFAREKEAVADISHELRTPIASLLATIDVTLRKPRTPEQYRTTLEDCRGIAKQLWQLVERIMTLASLDAGAARGAVTRVDATELAGGCAVVIRPLAEAHGLKFGLTAVGPAELDTDQDRLREVLMNLLHNAVEYNRPEGRVELSVRAVGERVVFEVRDTGIGMTDVVKAKIFDRFFRADPSRTATGVHAGLGLAIVKEYVDRLGGVIEVESTPGSESLFRVSFPGTPVDQS
ncbi:MAG TPA: HAMP domain-containing sensor histidine kinase [Urbifossiella sp.]|nr:HAMP domain-containing sensor histidine kinase [Urbifossiella sp.]